MNWQRGRQVRRAMPSSTPLTPLRLPAGVLADLRQYAADNNLSVNAAAVRLLAVGLDAEDRAFLDRHGDTIRAEVDRLLTARAIL